MKSDDGISDLTYAASRSRPLTRSVDSPMLSMIRIAISLFVLLPLLLGIMFACICLIASLGR